MEENSEIIDGLIVAMNLRKINLNAIMGDISSKQHEIDIQRSRIQGQIHEIDQVIRDIEKMGEK